MKKNAMLKIAAILMVAVLLTTCAISSTFAKYTTTDTETDSARVAKWGVTVDTTVEGLFLETYDSGAVASTEAVVAPGTANGDVKATSVITGQPEVKVQVSNVVNFVITGWLVDGAFYCPLVVTVNGEPISGLDYDDADEFMAAVNEAGTATKTFMPYETVLEDLEGEDEIDTEITWKWAFEDTSDNAKQTNEKDTKLGDLAAKGNAPTVAITITTTVDQLDA